MKFVTCLLFSVVGLVSASCLWADQASSRYVSQVSLPTQGELEGGLVEHRGRYCYGGLGGLWRTDGTTLGTQPLSEEDVRGPIVSAGEWLYYWTVALDDDYEEEDEDLWAMDGESVESARLVMDAFGDPIGRDLLGGLGDQMYWLQAVGRNWELWRASAVDKTTAKVLESPRGSAPVLLSMKWSWNGKLYFYAPDPESQSTALWESDGTTDGTVPVIVAVVSTEEPVKTADAVTLIATVNRDETVMRLQASGEVVPVISQETETYGDAKALWSDGEHVIFSGSDSVFGAEPWLAEEKGARRLTDIYDGKTSSNPEILGVLDGDVLVWARGRDGTHLRRVAITDGSAEVVENLPEEIEDHQFVGAMEVGSSAYLVSHAANAVGVLWLSRLDGGTQEVTTMGSEWLTEIDSYDAGWPYLYPQGDAVLLSSWQTAFGEELYKVDAGEDPVLVKDGNVAPIAGGRAVLIQPIPVSLDMQYFTVNTDLQHEYVRLRADGSTLTLRTGAVERIGWSLTTNPQTGVSFFVDPEGLWSLLPGASAPRNVIENGTVRPEFNATNVPFSVTTSGVLFLATNNFIGVGSTFHTDGFSSSSTKSVVPNQVFKDTPVKFKDFNYFVNDNPSLNVQPWFTNGTTTERFLTFSSEVIVAGATESHIFFTADGPGDPNGIVLWSYTGSGSVLSVGAPAVSPFLVPPVSIDDHFYYVGFDESGAELWVSDGTCDGTIRLTDIQEGTEFGAIKNLTAMDDVVFFAADDGEHGWELWTTDGTEEGTRRVTDLQEGGADSLADTDVSIMRASGDDLYFAANDGIHGTELWRVDKDGNAPELVQDLMPGGASSHPQNFQIINGRLFFQADDPGQPMMTLREIVSVPNFESGSVNVQAAESEIILTFGEKTNRSYLLMESDDLRTWRAVRSYNDAEAGRQQTVRVPVESDRSPVFYRVQSN